MCRQKLNGDTPIQTRVVCRLDLAHSARAEALEDLVRTDLGASTQSQRRNRGSGGATELAGSRKAHESGVASISSEHRQHFASYFRVWGGSVYILRPFRFSERGGGLVDRVRQLPALVRHRPRVSAKASSSQFRVKLQFGQP